MKADLRFHVRDHNRIDIRFGVYKWRDGYVLSFTESEPPEGKPTRVQHIDMTRKELTALFVRLGDELRDEGEDSK